MAAIPFNCNKIKRSFWPFTMKDKREGEKIIEKGKEIVVRMPQKGVFEAIKALDGPSEDSLAMNDTEAIYNLLAAILSNNMGGVKISTADLTDYDIEECTAILNAYMEFVDELKTDPN